MERDTVTAAELAAKFEVSSRTIYRDLEKLALGGIPIYTNRGKGGGISLTEGFVIDRSILSQREQKDIILGLNNLKSLNIPGEEGVIIDEALSRLGSLFKMGEKDWISVDISSWEGGKLDTRLFQSLKKAILEEDSVQFTYFGRQGTEDVRQVEPCQLQFKSRSWYLYAYCLKRSDFRLFKLTRMGDLHFLNQAFTHKRNKELLSPDLPLPPSMVNLILKIDASLAWRVYDEFPHKAISRNGKGEFTVRISYPEDEWVYGYLMSFGDKAQVLSPNRIRRGLKKKFIRAVKNYS